MRSAIFWSTYVETTPITVSASEFAAFSAFFPAAASTVISTRGETFLAWPALTTAAEVTWPRSWPSVSPLASDALRRAASERMIWLTVFGFVARLWIWPPPEVVKG